METSGVLAKLTGSTGELHQAEKRVADFLLSSPESVKTHTISEIAKKSGASEATIVRLCRILGFQGYRDFKLSVIEDLSARIPDSTFSSPVMNILPHDNIEQIIRKVFQVNIKILHETLKTMDISQLNKAICVLNKAGRVEVYGVGSSAPIATDTHHRFLLSGLTSSFCTDPHMQIINASLLSKNDIAFGISYTGRTRDTIDAIETAKKAGATTIAMTNFPNSPLARLADVTLLTTSRRSAFRRDDISVRIAQLGIIDALCISVAIKKGKVTKKKITKIYEVLDKKKRQKHR